MMINVASGLNVKSDSGLVSLDIDNEIYIHNSPTLQENIANIADKIMAGDMDIAGTLGGGLMSFGSDSNPANIIDTFERAAFNFEIRQFAQSLKETTVKLYKYALASNATDSLYPTVKRFALDAENERTLFADIGASFSHLNLTGDYYINIPYFQNGLLWDKDAFMEMEVKNIVFKDSIFTTSALLYFPENPVSSEELTKMLGNWVFHRDEKVSNVVTGIFS